MDANRTTIAIVEEPVYGTTPATPAFERIRIKSADLKSGIKTKISDELITDRQVADLIRVGFEAGATIPMEAVYGNIDTPLEGLYQSRWVRAPVRHNFTAGSAVTAVTATQFTVNSNNVTRDRYGSFAVGHLCISSGFVNTSNSRMFRAAAGTNDTNIITPTALTVDAAPAIGARVKAVGIEGASGDIVATVAPNGLTSAALNFINLGLTIGQWVKIGGSLAANKYNSAACNGWARLSSVAASVLQFDIVPTGWTSDTGVGKSIQVFMGDYLRNGTTKIGYSIEQQFTDLAAPEFTYIAGNLVGTGEMSGDQQDILQESLSFQGLTFTSPATARFAGATDVAAPTGDVINTSSNVGRILEAGVPTPGTNFVLSMSLSIDNSLRRRNAIGSLNSVDIGSGRCMVKGSLKTYYGSKAIYDKVLAGTASSYSAVFLDPGSSKAIVIDIPRLKFDGGDPQVPGVDTDRVIDTPFTGLKHPNLGYTIQRQRFEYIEL